MFEPSNRASALMLSRLLSSPGSSLARRWCSSLPAVADVTDTWRNPAAVLHGVDDLRFENFPLPSQLQPGAVRVQMKSVGICGSDVAFLKKVRRDLCTIHLDTLLHLPSVDCHAFITTVTAVHSQAIPCAILAQGRIGHYMLKDPMAIGHECAGYNSHGILLLFSRIRRQTVESLLGRGDSFT